MIEALRDRIDVVVQALAFNTALPRRAARRASRRASGPRRSCRRRSSSREEEVDRHARRDPGRRRCPRRCAGGSSSSPASSSSASRPPTQLEYKTKDTARLAGVDWHLLTAAETGPGPAEGPRRARPATACRCAALMTLLMFAKAMAYFRGSRRGDARGRAPDPAVRAARQARAGPRRAVLRGRRERARSAPTASAGSGGCSTCRAPSTTASTSTATTRSARCWPSSPGASTA